MMADPIYCNLSKSQNEALEKLRSIMSEELREFEHFNKSFVLYRFLKARDWDVNKAEMLLKKCIQWRRQNNLKDYQPPEILQMYFHNMHIGPDKEGCPIFYIPVGKCDVKGFVNSMKQSDVIKTVAQITQRHELGIEEKSAEKKCWLRGGLLLFDFKGMNLANATNRKGIETIIQIARFGQDTFPERLKAVIFLNTPAIFNIPFGILKKFLPPATKAKIQCFSTEGWQEKILELVDADQLPAFLGGTRTDPDGNPDCKTIVMQMGIIDESFYLDQNSENTLGNVPGVSTVIVPPFSTKKIRLHAENAGSVIKWEFEVKAGDIGFGLFHEETQDEVTPVVVLDKVDAKDCVETGVYNCEKSGNYYAEFDNSYSWLRSKEIFYVFKVYCNELKMEM